MDSELQPTKGHMKGIFSTSRLCSLVLDVWSFVIQEKKWALVQPPGPLGSSGSRSPLSSMDDLEEDCEMADDEIHENDNSPPSTTNLIPAAPERDLRWEMARFLLNEERDRLCLWQSNFSKDELDQLIKAPRSSPTHAFGVAVVESLLRMGDALLGQTGRPCRFLNYRSLVGEV